MRRSMGKADLTLKAFHFPLWCNPDYVRSIFLMHLHITLCGLQILQKPEAVSIPSYLSVQAAFSI